MPAYVLVEIEILDSERYDTYKQLAQAAIGAYDGRYLVRGGKVEALEGNWQPKRLVILEFPSVDKAKAWWNSPEYAAAKELRQRTAKSQMIVAEGL
jgi:uncharacterized protein (DUF1330 family)